MEADFSVELGQQDAVLEVPWRSPPGGPVYFDLKRRPELLPQVEEAQRCQELGRFLAAANSPAGSFETAKCDVWTTDELQVEDEMFAAAWKFGSYVDLLLSDPEARFSLAGHETFVRRLSQQLRQLPELLASADFIVRRCYYHAEGGTRDGFCVTFYLFGYGSDPVKAREQWARALELVTPAVLASGEGRPFS